MFMYRLSIQVVVLIVLLTVATFAVRAFHPDAKTLDAGLTRDAVGEGEIWVGDAFDLTRQPGGVLWIDIRPPEIYEDEHVPGAFNCWPTGGDLISDVIFEIMGSDKFTPDTTIVLYCSSTDCNVSHQVKSEIAAIAPDVKVLVLAGGWQEYRRYLRRTGV